MHILHYNARSLHPKFDELCAICDVEKPDVLSLKHGSVMTLPKLNAPFMDTDVLDATETWWRTCFVYNLSNKLEFNIMMVGPNRFEFPLVSEQNVNRYIHWGVVPSTC